MKILKPLYKYLKLKYNLDELLNLFLIIYLILIILNLFLRTYIINYVELFLLIIIVFRIFSKNKYKRQKENESYLKVRNKIIKPFKNIRRNYRDRKTYIYKRCHKCKTTLRLPLPFERGIHYSKCPNCKNRVMILSLRKQKIEIIK